MGSTNDELGFTITPRKVTVFLGGTCNGSLWRDELIPLLGEQVAPFNPVRPDWDDDANRRELAARYVSDFVLYVITPKMEGAYAVAEAVDDSNKRPKKTLFCLVGDDGDAKFTPHQFKALGRVASMIELNGGKTFGSLASVSEWLNNA